MKPVEHFHHVVMQDVINEKQKSHQIVSAEEPGESSYYIFIVPACVCVCVSETETEEEGNAWA